MRIVDAGTAIETQRKSGAFRPEISFRRFPLRAIEVELLSRSRAYPVLALGGTGSGKSTWLCQAAAERRDAKEAVVYLEDRTVDAGRLFDATGLLAELHDIAMRSPDQRVLAIADDAAGRPARDVLLGRMFELARAVVAYPSIRLLLAMRSDAFGAFLDRNVDAVPRGLFREINLRPLERHELIAIAKALPPPKDSDAEMVRRARERAATDLWNTTDHAALIPALAVSFLETIDTPAFLGGLSRFKMYSHVYYGRVLRGSPNVPVARRSTLLKELATQLITTGEDTVAVGPTDRADAEIAYRELLSERFLEQRVDDYGMEVGFVDDDFLAFVAAVAINGSTADCLRDYLAKGEQYPRARRAAAFFVARVISGTSVGAEQVFTALPPDDLGFLQLVGEFDREAFLALLPILARDSPVEAIRLVDDLRAAGFGRLAVDGAALLLECVPAADRKQVSRLYGEALCKVERLEEAWHVLANLERDGAHDSQLFYLLGEIAVARRQLDEAQKWYSRILDDASVTIEARAKALHGLGDLLDWHGDYRGGARMMKQAVRLYEKVGDSADLAEACGDVSLALVHLKKCKEAREYVAKSRTVNLRLAMSFPGLIIVEGLEGNVDLCEGNLDLAEKRLTKCLNDCRSYGLRWREGWCLNHLAEVEERRGNHEKAADLHAEANRIHEEL